MSENWLVDSPASLGDIQASTLPCAGLTAWFALVECGGLRVGESVLVQGTGGVSMCVANRQSSRHESVYHFG